MSEPTPAPPPSGSRSRTLRKLSHRQPLPRRWDSRGRLFLDRIAQPALRIAAWGALALIGGVFVNHLYWGDRFRLDQIQVAGPSRITSDAIRGLLLQEAGIDPGVSMFAFSTGSIDDLVERVPSVRSARVEKIWPRTLSIVVEERQSSAIFVSDHGSYVVDEEGLLFSQATAEDLRSVEGPVYTGWDGLALDKGSRLPQKEFQAVTRDLSMIRKANPSLYSNLSEVRWNETEGMTLILREGEVIMKGFLPMEEAGPLIETVLAEKTPPGLALDYLRLTPERSLALAWRPAPVPAELIMAATEQ